METHDKEIETILMLKSLIAPYEDALVGLKYLLYIDDSAENPYICGMCDKKGVFNNIMHHFISISHRLVFLVNISTSSSYVIQITYLLVVLENSFSIYTQRVNKQV